MLGGGAGDDAGAGGGQGDDRGLAAVEQENREASGHPGGEAKRP